MTAVRLTDAEKEGSVHLRDSVIPLRTLKDSNFLKLYDATPRKPSYAGLMRKLPHSVHKDYKMCYEDVKHEDNSLGLAAVQFWTREDTGNFYRKVNAALLSDNRKLLSKWIYLIRALNRFLVDTRPKTKLLCFRKSDMNNSQSSRIQVGRTYRIAMYTATSTDPEFISQWTRNSGKYFWKFNVPKDSYNACCIEEYSYHATEAEVLLPPYSTIKIIGKELDGCITANVLDNSGQPLTLRTIVA